MSESSLRIIPVDPTHVPSREVQERARAMLESLLPGAREVRVAVYDEIVFVDPGGNFDGVLCPACGADLDDWWQDAMDEASESRFASLQVQLPCCETIRSLNDLDYSWPAGFARFVLEVAEPGIAALDGDLTRQVEVIVGQPMRAILAHD